MAPHSSTLAWKIPWTEEPGRLQSKGSLESDTTERLHFHFHALEKEMATHSSVLAWRIPGTGKSGGLPSMGSHRVRHDWSDLAANIINHQGNVNWSHNEISLHTCFEWLLSKRQKTASVGNNLEKREPLSSAGGNVNWCMYYAKQYGGPSKS